MLKDNDGVLELEEIQECPHGIYDKKDCAICDDEKRIEEAEKAAKKDKKDADSN